jgi:tRNA G37 N-methylase TrmD
MNFKVPEVLLNGNHKLIDEWRKKDSILRKKKFLKSKDKN